MVVTPPTVLLFPFFFGRLEVEGVDRGVCFLRPFSLQDTLKRKNWNPESGASGIQEAKKEEV